MIDTNNNTVVAIIGAGIGAQHLDGYRAHPELFAVKTICDLNTERATELANGSQAQVTGDFDSVLRDKDIDLIDICLPPHLHYETIVKALEAGKHVICEKPLVGSVAETDKVIAAAERTGKQVFPVFQYRYGKGLDQLRALIDAGLAGKAYAASLETHWNRGSAYYAVPWRGTWAGEAGGAVLGHAIHNHDLLTYVLGPVENVTALTSTRVNPIEVEDCAAIIMQMHSGALVTSSITLGAATDTTRIRVCFEGFTATSGTEPYAPGKGSWTFEARAPMDQSRIDATLAALEPEPQGYAGFFKAVAMGLDGDPSRVVTLKDGRRSLEFVTAVYHSARTRQMVSLPLEKEHPLYSGWQPDIATPELSVHQQHSQQQQ
ncbi:MAG: Gfo/Idh/MocA family oxidoreductase [Pseudomonadota bacterium]